jgi:serine-type D-Ala-D-Ala carboxypeptidase/endopeptidase (penicillin-binding protein 4)
MNMNYRTSAPVIVIVLLWMMHTTLSAQQRQAQPGIQALRDELQRLKSDACLKNASWGFYAMSLSDGQMVGEQNADLSLQPASAMKVLTTACALNELGSDFRFVTSLEYSGYLDSLSGTLYGNLYIRGGGDPTTGSKRFGKEYSADSLFASFSQALQKAGIKNISGKLIGDASFFDDNPGAYGWGWEDVGNYYAAGAWGINCYENSYRLYFDAGNSQEENAKLLRCEPEMPQITFVNRVGTGKAGSGDNVVIYGGPWSNLRILTGTVPAGKKNFDVDGAIPDPPEYLTGLFMNHLNAKGITVSDGFTTLHALQWKGIEDTARRSLLSEFRSPPLKRIIHFTNINSVNVFAEAVLRMCGKKAAGKGSTESGSEIVTAFWNGRGMNTEGFEMHDGCGLSRRNLVTARQMCSALKIARSLKTSGIFESTLPVAGKSGGIAGMFKGHVCRRQSESQNRHHDRGACIRRLRNQQRRTRTLLYTAGKQLYLQPGKHA